LSRRVPLDSLCPDATFAEHNATTSSRKSGRDMLKLSYFAPMRSRSVNAA
jgi:hypothetical protein